MSTTCKECGGDVTCHRTTELVCTRTVEEVNAPNYQVVRQDNGPYAVKVKRGDRWITVCETYLVQGLGDAEEVAGMIAEMLNKQ
jgi:hypothetical protein